MKGSMQDWADIRLFLAILDHGSLVAAAGHLELTQPQVGRRLSAFEERLGTPLFVRSGRGMQLADAGAAILESARRMESEMLAIERSVEIQSKGLCGQVTISATEGTGTEWLTPVLFAFHQQYPDISVKVLIESRAVDLIHREADIALRMGRPKQPDLIARRLVTIGFGLYATQKYLQDTAAVSTIDSLSVHQLVVLEMADNRMESNAIVLAMGKKRGQATSYSTNSPAAQLSAVRAGFGIGMVSHRWASMNPTLVRVLPEYTPLEVELWLVSHEELRHSARIRALSDFIAESVVSDEALFATGERAPKP
ncbi:MAG: DNA-binding transcriptional LysR family regulator [Alcanivorax sp.]|jgi:DNA-binding transcriptional LysR family regulator